MAGGPGGRGGFGDPAAMFDIFDKDKDGKLSEAEIPDRMKENVGRIDTNKNKTIEKEEWLKFAAEMPQRGGGGRGGPPGGGPAAGGGQ